MMYLEHFGLREQPFGVTPDPKFLYFSAEHAEALAALHYGLTERRGLLVLTAAPGAGKTTLLHYLVERWKERAQTAFVIRPPETREQMMAAVLEDLGVATASDYAEGRRALQNLALERHAQGRRLLLVFDEAQAIPEAVLEEIRLLSNFETPEVKLIEIILAGQPELAVQLDSPGYEPVGQRALVRARIGPLNAEEVRRCIEHRLRVAGREKRIFSRRAMRLAAEAYLKRNSAQVRSLVSRVVRGSAIQLLRRRRLSKQYLNVGCGDSPHRAFINLDRSWSPQIDLCWDITKSLPLGDNSVRGIYTEHCLEHIPYEDCRRLLGEFLRILQPGGVVRIAVPDAELYLDLYQLAKHGHDVSFPYPQTVPLGTPMMYVNRAFRNYGHLFAYDFETLQRILLEAGFSCAERRRFRDGGDAALLIDSERRAVESLYVEAVKGVPVAAGRLVSSMARAATAASRCLSLLSFFLLAAISYAQSRPTINAVVSAADFQPGVAFEGLASVFGSGFSDQEFVAASVPLPTQLGQTQVRYCAPLSAVWDDCVPMQLIYVGPTQINLFLSYGSRDESQTTYGALVVRRNNTLSDETRRQAFVPVAPRIFAMGFDCNFDPAQADASPCGLAPQRTSARQAVRGALTDSGGSLVTSNNPARAGMYYSLWLTGLGRIANSRTLFPVQITLGGIPVPGSSGAISMALTALFAGQSPQFSGLDQINFQLPQNLMGSPGTAGAPGASLHPCGDYRMELTLSLTEGAGNAANVIQIPVLIRNGDVACAN